MKTGLLDSRASSFSFGKSASRKAERRAVITTTTLSTDGDLIDYYYPMKLIENNKNLVYNNGGSEIFK